MKRVRDEKRNKRHLTPKKRLLIATSTLCAVAVVAVSIYVVSLLQAKKEREDELAAKQAAWQADEAAFRSKSAEIDAIYEAMEITFKEDKAVAEYGAQVDANELVDTVKGGTLAGVPAVDTMAVGEKQLIFMVENKGVQKRIAYIIEVKDTVAPAIKLKKNSISAEVGDRIQLGENIVAVSDPVDGELPYVSERKVADGQTGYYTLKQSSVNLQAAGSYTVGVLAADRNGNEANTTFTVRVTKPAEPAPPKEPVVKKPTKLINVPYISQAGSMPNGCEVVSTAMVLQYWGYQLSPGTVFDRYMPHEAISIIDGKVYGPHPNDAYVGDPRSATEGYGAFPPVVVSTLKAATKGTASVTNVTGKSLETLVKEYIDHDIPVIFWATVNMRPNVRNIEMHVKATGETYYYPAREHCLVLVGYDANHYYFNDPYASNGVVGYEKATVAQRYATLGYKAVVMKRTSQKPPEEPEEPSKPDKSEPEVSEPSGSESGESSSPEISESSLALRAAGWPLVDGALGSGYTVGGQGRGQPPRQLTLCREDTR